MADDSLQIVFQYILSPVTVNRGGVKYMKARCCSGHGTRVRYMKARFFFGRSQWSKVYEGMVVCVLRPCVYTKVLTLVNALISVVLHVVYGGAQFRQK